MLCKSVCVCVTDYNTAKVDETGRWLFWRVVCLCLTALGGLAVLNRSTSDATSWPESEAVIHLLQYFDIWTHRSYNVNTKYVLKQHD